MNLPIGTERGPRQDHRELSGSELCLDDLADAGGDETIARGEPPRHCSVVARPIFEKYRDAADQASRYDIAAAAAAHQELGRDYDDAVAEGLVDRIGSEIDKRVDARLRTGSSGSRSPAESSRSGKGQAMFLGAGIGAGVTGIVAMIASDTESPVRAACLPSGVCSRVSSFPVMTWVIAVWIVLAVAGLGVAVVRMYRGREH